MTLTISIRAMVFAAISFFLLPSAYAQTQALVPGGMARLTFFDDFNGPSLDRSKWNSNYTNATRNLPGEEQIYTPDSFEIRDSHLKIIANRRNVSGHKFTSGALTTYGSFDQIYGYIEIRARVPEGRGLWPALWMLPSDRSWPPEIDIMEFLGRDVQNIWTTYHWLDAKGQHLKDGSGWTRQDWTSDFHIFALQWRPGLLVWYLDGKEVKRISGPHVPTSRMFLLMNLAIGGRWAGPPSSTTRFPAAFEIDYVRAYQYEDLIEIDDRPFRYLITYASDQMVKRGDELRLDFGIDNRALAGAHRYQLMLKNAISEVKIAQYDSQIILDRRGDFRRTWTVRIPKNIEPGLYVLSYGLFLADWTRLDWLNNAKTILIQE